MLILSLLVTILFYGSGAMAQNISAVIPSTLGPPFLIMKNGQPEGLVKDYMSELSKNLNIPFSFKILPKYRIDTPSRAELNCYTNPSWVEAAERYQWSIALFQRKDMLLSTKENVQNLDDLKNQKVGMVLGYKYPRIEGLISRKVILRDDAASEEMNLKKLLSGRISHAIVDLNYYEMYKKENPKARAVLSRFVVEEYAVNCLLAKSSVLSLPKLNKGIEELKSSGQLDAVFSRYR